MRPFIVVLLLGMLFSSQGIAQQSRTETFKYLYAEGEATDGLGEGVALSDDMAFLGAPAVGRANFSPGYVVVVSEEDGMWTFSQELVASDGQLDDQFGFSVALHGTIGAVGAPEAGEDGAEPGAVYLFEKEGDTWNEVQKIVPTGEGAGAEFGKSVAVYEDIVLVGAPEQRINDDPVGAAYVYELEDGQIVDEQQIIYGDFSFVNEFGESVALREDLLVVGVPNRGLGAQNFGSVVLYEEMDGDWVFKQELEASDAEAQDVLGSSVAVSGSWLLAGAPGEDQEGSGAGAVYVFQEIEGQWSEAQKLVSPDPNDQDAFGERVSISGPLAVVGASRNDDAANGAGTAYLFAYDGMGWQFVEQLFASDAAIGDDFALSIAIDDSVIVAGASGENGDTSSESIGAAYFFDLNATSVSSEAESQVWAWNLIVGSVYPNPTGSFSHVSVRVQQSMPVTVALYNTLGQRIHLVHDGTMGAGTHELNVPTDRLVPGVYYLRVTSKREVAVRAVSIF